MIASASYDATVRIWDPATADEPTVLTGHPRNVTSVEFVGDGSTLASEGIGDEGFVWSSDTAERIALLGWHGEAVSGISVGEDGCLWTAGYDGSVLQFDTGDWTERTSFDLPTGTTPSEIDAHPRDDVIAVTRGREAPPTRSAGAIITLIHI